MAGVSAVAGAGASARRARFADFDRSFAGVVFRLRTGAPWRDLPPRFGPWQRAWALHRRWARLGVWDALLAEAQAVKRPDLAEVFKAGTTVRAHQKAAGQKGAAPPVQRSGARVAA